MTRSLRRGRVFVDWSQNNPAKTTVAPYSMRGVEQPHVAAPRTWQEIQEPGLAQLDIRQVGTRLRAGLDPWRQIADVEATRRGDGSGGG